MHFQSPLMHVAWKKVCRTEHAKREERQTDRQRPRQKRCMSWACAGVKRRGGDAIQETYFLLQLHPSTDEVLTAPCCSTYNTVVLYSR